MKQRFSLYVLLVVLILSSTLTFADNAYNVTYLDNPAPGYIIVDHSEIDLTPTVNVQDNSGNNPYTKTFLDRLGDVFHTQVLSNGRITAQFLGSDKWLLMDENFNIIDSFTVTSPYVNDYHDFMLLSNGNYLLLGLKSLIVDMSIKVEHGAVNANVTDHVIQEITPNGTVVFTWIASEHYSITDATEDIDLTQPNLDPFHINAFSEDSDGNLIISARHLDEVTKIDRHSGAIIWRLGGTKCRNNQFTFTNDSHQNFTGFSHPHNAHVLPNGHLLLFDNGNFKPTEYSRAVEYDLNIANKTASKVWEYRKSPDIFVEAMGSVQRLPNGNTLIGWGGDSHFSATEVTSGGTKVFEMVPITPNPKSYRVYRSIFKMDAVSRTVSSASQYDFNDSKYKTGLTLNIQSLTGSAQVSVEKHAYMPYNRTFAADTPFITLPFRWVINQRGISNVNGKISISTDVLGEIIHPEWLQIYRRSTENTGAFSSLTTTYNSTTKLLEASINGFGEFMVGYKEYFTPQLELPVDNAFGEPITPRIKWFRTTPDERFDIQVALSINFDSPILDTSFVDGNQLNLYNLRYFTNYYWRVRTRTSFGSGSWSSVYMFQTIVDKPNLSTPKNLSKEILTSDKLNWASVAGATNYRLQIADNSAFSLPIVDIQSTGNLSYDYKDLQNYTNYYWRICASNRSVFGAWSSIWQFQTAMAVPVLSLPIDKATGVPTSGSLQWKKVIGATIYSLQIATDSAYQNIIINDSGISTNKKDYKDLICMTGYFWRVKALNDETKSAWSPSSYFFTYLPAPALILPKDNAGNIATKVVYSWGSVPGATEYQFDISEDSLFKIIHVSTKLAGTLYTSKDLKYNTQYFWRVKSFKQSIEGGLSAVRKFTTGDQNAVTWPDLSSPSDNSYKISANADLSWEQAPNALTYNIEVSSDNLFTDKLQTETVITSTKTTVDNLENNHKYYWHVRSCKNANCSEWSYDWSFTTLLASSKLVAPLNKQTNIKINDTLRWEAVDGGMFYILDIATDYDFNNITEAEDNLTELYYTPKKLDQLTTYYWRIKPINNNNTGDWSEIRSFVTGKIAGVIENSDISRIYPNPASDYIYLDNIQFTSLQIFDAMGNIVLTTTEPSTKVDIRNLPNGVYNLRTFTINNNQTYRLIVIK